MREVEEGKRREDGTSSKDSEEVGDSNMAPRDRGVFSTWRVPTAVRISAATSYSLGNVATG